MEKQNEKQDQPSATIHFSGETLLSTESLAAQKEEDDWDNSKQHLRKLEALQTESGQRIIELVERVEKLKEQLSLSQRIVEEAEDSRKRLVNNEIHEQREHMYKLFESIPHLNVWIEGLIRELLVEMQFEGTIVDRDDVRAIVEEEIDDAKIEDLNYVWLADQVRGLLVEMQTEGTIVDRDDVQAIVEEGIDDAKEDAQTIATEKIEDLIKDALDSVEVESHLIY